MKKKGSFTDLEKRLLYILHRGWVEARLLAMAQRAEQLQKLADALEPIPGYLLRGPEDCLDLIRFNLGLYEEEYRGRCFDYLAILDQAEVPEF